MCAIADQPHVIFAGYVATVTSILRLVKLCLLTVLVDVDI